jgi:hypothetical protein
MFTAGWNKALRHTEIVNDRVHINEKVDENANIMYGIHVGLTPKSVLSILQCHSQRKLVRVRCYLKDLIGVDKQGQAVFTKVFLPKSEYAKAVAG